MRSAENADLARGYANVVVLSPFGGRTGPLPAGQFEGLRRFPGADLESQVEANQMDLATRIPAALASFAQGKLEATRLTFH